MHLSFFSACIGITVLSLGVLGYDPELKYPSWCWIDSQNHNALLWQYVTGKAWEILSYFLSVVLYAAVKCTLIKQVSFLNSRD